MNNARNKHDKQDQINPQQNQQQKTRHEQGPKKQVQRPTMLPEDLKHENHEQQDHEHEHPETRLTR